MSILLRPRSAPAPARWREDGPPRIESVAHILLVCFRRPTEHDAAARAPLGYLARDEGLGRRREVPRSRSSSSTPIAYVLGAIVDRGGKCEEETRRAAPLHRFHGGFSIPRGLRLLAPLLEIGLLRVDVREVCARRLGVGMRLADRNAPSETPWHTRRTSWRGKCPFDRARPRGARGRAPPTARPTPCLHGQQ